MQSSVAMEGKRLQGVPAVQALSRQNRRIALESLISPAVNKERKKDLDLYKGYADDPYFKKAFDESNIRILALHEKSMPAR